jgi:hypothetical protein
MALVEIDRQRIERRDFPITRRGYEPAAVDAHLRGVAGELEELQRAAAGPGPNSLASTAGTQVQSIIQAAEAAAADIERQAAEDAERTRTDALTRARAHVAAVAEATATLLARVESMEEELGALQQSARGGASRLAEQLRSVETNMQELYGAATGAVPAVAAVSTPGARAASPPAAPSPAAEPALAAVAPEPAEPAEPAQALELPLPEPSPAVAELVPAEPATEGNGDLDGARLIALNMALNGEPRADADRYLAENFQLADRQTLIDEVYAAIEG